MSSPFNPQGDLLNQGKDNEFARLQAEVNALRRDLDELARENIELNSRARALLSHRDLPTGVIFASRATTTSWPGGVTASAFINGWLPGVTNALAWGIMLTDQTGVGSVSTHMYDAPNYFDGVTNGVLVRGHLITSGTLPAAVTRAIRVWAIGSPV